MTRILYPALAPAAAMLIMTGLPFRHVHAQSPSFEVVSVKPNNSGDGRSSETTGPGTVTAVNISTSSLIQQAFGVKEFQISDGPAWLTGDSYDVAAKTGTSKDLTEVELRPYLQALLADRFRLKYHRDTKELQIYSLVVAKGDPRLAAHAGEGASSNDISAGSGKTSLSSTNISMESFAGLLGSRLDRLVLENTGLTGRYDLKLTWAPDPTADTDPSLFTALQEQLGLKLESTKGSVDIIVIDSVEKPSAN